LDGLTINATTGALSGTPTATGSFTSTITASNGIGSAATQSFTLTVVEITITTTSLPDATIGTHYTTTLQESGGVAPFKWTVAPRLPRGLQLDRRTGVISGKVNSLAPTGTKTYTFTLSDNAKPKKHTTTASLALTVEAA
jgi:hypothetical protein